MTFWADHLFGEQRSRAKQIAAYRYSAVLSGCVLLAYRRALMCAASSTNLLSNHAATSAGNCSSFLISA